MTAYATRTQLSKVHSEHHSSWRHLHGRGHIESESGDPRVAVAGGIDIVRRNLRAVWWRGRTMMVLKTCQNNRIAANGQPNQPAPRNAGIGPGLAIEHLWPGVRDPGR